MAKTSGYARALSDAVEDIQKTEYLDEKPPIVNWMVTVASSAEADLQRLMKDNNIRPAEALVKLVLRTLIFGFRVGRGYQRNLDSRGMKSD